MEIEIPDLQDVRFTQECDLCNSNGTIRNKMNELIPCWRCDGTGTQLLPVGERLLEFLTKIGVAHNPDGWKNDN